MISWKGIDRTLSVVGFSVDEHKKFSQIIVELSLLQIIDYSRCNVLIYE